MAIDRKKLYIISSATLAVLLLTLFAPMGSGRIIAAILLLPIAILTMVIIKKRTALSLYNKQVLLLVSVIGLLYLVFYYVSGLYFGFTKTGYGFKADIIFGLVIPIGVIIVCNELIRHVLCVQGERLGKVFAYFISLTADVVICATIPAITNMATFMEVIGLALFPGILSNLLFNYLSARYGFLPNTVYKALTVWVFYLIPYGSGVSNSLLGFFNLMLPIVIYVFIDSLYEKKKRYALGNVSVFRRVLSRILTVIVVIIMLGTVMLVSNQFTYGAYVIATPSMTGELNPGDVAIYKTIGDTPIIEGEVIVFEKDGIVIVHRVVDIQTINGITRYYTQGDANEDMDAGYILRSDIIGHAQHKIPYIGFPTIWVRNLFK
jgi:signal peptidase